MAAVKNKIFAALDIGATRVVFAIGLQKDHGLEVIGIGQASNLGCFQGEIINIQATTEAILKAKREAIIMAGIDVQKVWLGISGNHIESIFSFGMAAIDGEEVTSEDVQNLIHVARATPVPEDKFILHAIPKKFKVDHRENIINPTGMTGSRLESEVHLITASRSALDHAVKCCDNANLQLDGVVYQPLASAKCLIDKEELFSGVTLVDIGGSTCNMLTFSNGIPVRTDVIPVGGNHFTRDISAGLRITPSQAEKIKKDFGYAIANSTGDRDPIEIKGYGNANKSIDRLKLCKILEARAEETLNLIDQKLSFKDPALSPRAGFVFTGGAVQLKGFLELGHILFEDPIRLGVPNNVQGLEFNQYIHFSSVIGILMHAMEKEESATYFIGKDIIGERWSTAKDQVKKYLENLF